MLCLLLTNIRTPGSEHASMDRNGDWKGLTCLHTAQVDSTQVTPGGGEPAFEGLIRIKPGSVNVTQDPCEGRRLSFNMWLEMTTL